VHFALFRGIRDSSATTIMAMLGSNDRLVIALAGLTNPAAPDGGYDSPRASKTRLHLF
jgi:hypothetical protein